MSAMERMMFVLVFVAAMGCAVVGGMFYAFSSFVMRALERIAPEQGVAAMNSINSVVVTPSFMLVFVGTALLCLGLAAGSMFWWPPPAGRLVLLAALLYAVGTFGLTMAVNQPMNLRLKAMQASTAAALQHSTSDAQRLGKVAREWHEEQSRREAGFVSSS